jgi:hypothetical protein
MTRKLFELSAALFLIVCSVALAGLLWVAPQALQAWRDHLQASQVQMERAASAVHNVAERVAAGLDEQTRMQKSVMATLDKTNVVLFEGSLAAASRLLEEQGALSPTASMEVIRGSIEKLDAVDPRLGQVARALHDASRR